MLFSFWPPALKLDINLNLLRSAGATNWTCCCAVSWCKSRGGIPAAATSHTTLGAAPFLSARTLGVSCHWTLSKWQNLQIFLLITWGVWNHGLAFRRVLKRLIKFYITPRPSCLGKRFSEAGLHECPAWRNCEPRCELTTAARGSSLLGGGYKSPHCAPFRSLKCEVVIHIL